MSRQFYFKQFSLAKVSSLNVKTVLFQAIKFNINTQFSSIRHIDRTHVLPCQDRVNLKWWQWRGTPHSPKLQHYWNLTIRLSSVISRTLIGVGVLHLCRKAVSVFYSPSWLGKHFELLYWLKNDKKRKVSEKTKKKKV